MKRVKLLDCTLRDGGHVVNGHFGKKVIKAIISDLVAAQIDIVEAGFIWDSQSDDDTARYCSIEELRKYLPLEMGNTKIALMADNVNVDSLEPYDGTVEYIRLSFRKNELDWAVKSAKILIEKGYKVYINPIHGSNISDAEYLSIIEIANQIGVYGFSIVDTFGAMRLKDMARLYYLIEHNLNKNIAIGIHLHENLGLAYSLAQSFLSISSPSRVISIDGSLFGMGKIPGNLCIEQIMDYLNNEHGSGYSLEPAYDAIDEFIMPIYEKNRWGYSIPYAISGQCSVHRTYAEYLANKDRLRTKDIRRILSSIEDDQKEVYNKEYIEKRYSQYLSQHFDDTEFISLFGKILQKYERIIIIAPGSSIRDYILDERMIKGACVISVNFNSNQFPITFSFFTNPKRLVGATGLKPNRILITSNLLGDVPDAGYVFSRNDLVYHNDFYCDDSTLMLLNLLKRCGATSVHIAGFDGFRRNAENFFDSALERKIRDDDYKTEMRRKIVKEVYGGMIISFLTHSDYE